MKCKFQQEDNPLNVFCSKNCHVNLLIKFEGQEIINDPELIGILLKNNVKVHIRKSHASEMLFFRRFIEEKGTDNYIDISLFKFDEEVFTLLIACVDLIQDTDPTLRAWNAFFKDIALDTFFRLLDTAEFFGYDLLLYEILIPQLISKFMKWDVKTTQEHSERLKRYQNRLICYFFQNTNLIQSHREKLLVFFPDGIPDPIHTIVKYGYDRILYFMYNHNHGINITNFEKYVLSAIELDRVNIVQVFLLISSQRNPLKPYFYHAVKHNRLEIVRFLLSKIQPDFDESLLIYTLTNKFTILTNELIKIWNLNAKDYLDLIIMTDANILRNLLQLDSKVIEHVKTFIEKNQLMNREVFEVLAYTMFEEDFRQFLVHLKEIGSSLEMINFIEEIEGSTRNKRIKF